MKKATQKREPVEIPQSLADPKFEEVRKMLLECSRETDKHWSKTTVANFFNAMTEKRRAEIAPFCMKWYNYLRKTCPNQYRDKLPPFFPSNASVQHAFLAVQIAVLACCSREEAQKVFREVGAASFIEKAVEQVLRFRKAPWTSEFLLFIAGLPGILEMTSDDYWRIYRRLVKLEIAKPIHAELWIRCMFSCGMSTKSLKNDPQLLDSDIWAVFELSSFTGNWSPTTYDNGHGAKKAFVALIAEGLLDKQRVIDGCFQSLSQPFTDHQTKWYVQLLELISLNEEEMRREERRFLDLMNHPNPTPRGLGIRIFESRFKKGLLDEQLALEYAPIILRESVKSKAKIGLAILDKIAAKNIPLRPKAVRAAIEGLRHEHPEIQDATLKLLLKYDGFSDPEIVRQVQSLSDLLPISIRKMIPETGRSAKPTAAQKSTTLVPDAPAKDHSITPVRNFEELLDLAAQLVEGFREIDDLERFLDGLARFGNDKPEDFAQKTAPLLKRTKTLIASTFAALHPENRRNREDAKFEHPFGHCPFEGHEIMLDLRFAVSSWILGELPRLEAFPKPVRLHWSLWHSPKGRVFTHFIRHGEQIWYHDTSWVPQSKVATAVMSKRIETVTKNVCAGKTIPLLSTPSHQGGGIDPVVFVRKLIESNEKRTEHGDDDKVLALIRLKPENREAALKTFERSKPSKCEWTDAVRYALGAENVKIGKTPHLWIAAARSRTPFGDLPALEKRFPNYGPDTGIAATYHFEIWKGRHNEETLVAVTLPNMPERLRDWNLYPILTLHEDSHQDYQERDGLFPWFLSIWPQNLDPAISLSISSHSQNLDKNYDYGFHYALRAIAASTTGSLRPLAVSALFLGIGMKCSSTSATATDTLITVIGDGLLNATHAAPSVRELLETDFLTLSRWIKPLNTVAQQSSLHAIFVHELLQGIVESLPPASLGSFLELFYELSLSHEKPIASVSCRDYLQSLTGSAKAAKLAKKLLQL